MGYHLEDTVELVKYCNVASGLKLGHWVERTDAYLVREAAHNLEVAIADQKREGVILHSCEAVFNALSALHKMGYDLADFNSVLRDYVDYKFQLITDSEAKEPDFKYDIPEECVFDNGKGKETVKKEFPYFDDLIGKVIAKSKEQAEAKAETE